MLLSQLDLLRCQLPSTFQSLSWALGAQKGVKYDATVDLVLLMGATLTSAKARCFVRLDAFEVRAYGQRQGSVNTNESGHESDEQEDEDELTDEDYAEEDAECVNEYGQGEEEDVAERRADVDDNVDDEADTPGRTHNPPQVPFQSFVEDLSAALPIEETGSSPTHVNAKESSSEEEFSEDGSSESESSSAASASGRGPMPPSPSSRPTSDPNLRVLGLSLASGLDYDRPDLRMSLVYPITLSLTLDVSADANPCSLTGPTTLSSS